MPDTTQDPNIVDPGGSSYSLRKPDSVPAADIPSMPMERILPRQTSTGNSRGVQQLGSPNVYVDSGSEQIIVSKTDSSNVDTPQVLMGNQATFGEGLYVTKPGISVITNSDPANFIFNSNQNVFKIVYTDTVVLPQMPSFVFPDTFSSSGVTVDTGILSAIPLLVIGIVVSGGSYQQLPIVAATGTGSGYGGIRYTISIGSGVSTSGTIVVGVDGLNFSPGTARGPFTIRYYVLQESAA